jgi:hypothetical protein
MQRKYPSDPLVAVLFAVFFGSLWYVSREIYGNALADEVVKFAAWAFGTTGERVTSIVAPYALPFGFAALILYAAYRVSYLRLSKTIFAEDPHAPALTLSLMTVTEIAEYLLDQSVWGWQTYAQVNDKIFVRDMVPDEMRRAGQTRDVRFIGTAPNVATAVEIDLTYWQYAFFDEKRIWDRQNNIFTTVSYSYPLIPGVGNYQFGNAPRVDVIRTWPRASMLRKVLTKIFLFLKFRWYWIYGMVSKINAKFRR